MSAFKARGGKLITIHGLADEAIYPQGSIKYYEAVAQKMGGLGPVADFFKLYLVPGMGHAIANGTTNPDASNPVPGHGQVYGLLTEWVEKGVAPKRFEISSSAAAAVKKTGALCPYPEKPAYQSGDSFLAASYLCR